MASQFEMSTCSVMLTYVSLKDINGNEKPGKQPLRVVPDGFRSCFATCRDQTLINKSVSIFTVRWKKFAVPKLKGTFFSSHYSIYFFFPPHVHWWQKRSIVEMHFINQFLLEIHCWLLDNKQVRLEKTFNTHKLGSKKRVNTLAELFCFGLWGEMSHKNFK